MRILTNFLLLLILLINFSTQAFPIPENKKATFDIFRKNKVIGTYEIIFSENNGNLSIETNIDIEVKLLFISVYKFSHQSKEIWKDGSFIRIDAHSNFEDEREYFIEGEIKDDFLFATGMDGELKLDKNLIPSNYWNQDVMYQDEIFDTQKGIMRNIEVQDLGYEEIKVNEDSIKCNKYIFNASSNPKDKGPFPEYTLWYAENNELVKFQFKDKNRDNKIITIIRSN